VPPACPSWLRHQENIPQRPCSKLSGSKISMVHLKG
jgi:hypothetical protein